MCDWSIFYFAVLFNINWSILFVGWIGNFLLDNLFAFQAFYEYINGASILEFLKEFLSHEDPNIRAKTCSALGNMCRHSPYFYASLVSREKKITIVILCIDILLICDILGLKIIQPIMWNLQGRYEIINLLIDRCADPDKRTRKFACFAVSFVF